RLDLAVIARAVALRTGLAETRNRAIDQSWIDLRKRGVADTELVHHAGTKIFHHHVGFSGKLPDDLDGFRPGEIERQAALVAVDRLPAGRKPAIGPFAAQGRATHVLAAAPLDLDDVGPEQRELVARVGASQHLGEVENFHAFERSGHVDFLLKTAASL